MDTSLRDYWNPIVERCNPQWWRLAYMMIIVIPLKRNLLLLEDSLAVDRVVSQILKLQDMLVLS